MWTDENTIVPILDRDSSAKDINNNMTVVGNYAVAFLDVHGFIWKGGDWQSLFPMRFFGQINERGQVVGFDNQRSWRWENGRFTEPVPLSPGAQAKASGINDLGVMVGWSMKSGDTAFPVIWTNDVPREMPTIRAGLAGGIARMNRVGEAIGQCLVNSTESRATLWRKNLATEIEDLIIGPGARPWRVSPRDINDVGTDRSHCAVRRRARLSHGASQPRRHWPHSHRFRAIPPGTTKRHRSQPRHARRASLDPLGHDPRRSDAA